MKNNTSQPSWTLVNSRNSYEFIRTPLRVRIIKRSLIIGQWDVLENKLFTVEQARRAWTALVRFRGCIPDFD